LPGDGKSGREGRSDLNAGLGEGRIARDDDGMTTVFTHARPSFVAHAPEHNGLTGGLFVKIF
jgi:hypothetical protein